MQSVAEADIIEGTIVLLRTDWNVPVQEGRVLDTTRIEASAETVNFCLAKGAKVIVLTHLGDGSDSLEPVVEAARQVFGHTMVRFVRDPWNVSSPDGAQVLNLLRSGEIAVMENLRFWAEKENDENFAKKLAAFGDIYVNEAFPVSHRAHASIVTLPKYLPHFAGFRFLAEYRNLSAVFEPEHPFFFILGGAKFETKLPLLKKFLPIADRIFVGGAIAAHLGNTDLAENPKIVLPIGDKLSLDATPETIDLLRQIVKESRMVLWNGPLGNYENGYTLGTESLAKILSEAQAKTIVGGGDTLAAIEKLGIKDNFAFVSTAGGAMLDFLANGTLPGIEALK